jgi:iron(III) transport system ATP-binding protein
LTSINAPPRRQKTLAEAEPNGRQMAPAGQIVALRRPAADMDHVLRPEGPDGVAMPASGAPAADTRSARPALQVDRVSRAYGPIRAVDSASLSVAPGEIVALVGHSGSGKSTLLRLVAGLERPDAGRVIINGSEVAGPASFVPPEARGVGMMFQDYALFPHLTVLKNVLFGLRALPRPEAIARARQALERVGLGDRQADYPHTLSGGEQQRVALARALVPRPDLLLMDEPFSNLDRRTRDVIRDDTTALLRDGGTTTVLVTHDPDDAMRVADRIMMMQAGRIVQSGTPRQLYKRPASLQVARFFSELNEIAGVCRNGAVVTPIGEIPAPSIAEGSAVTVCVRPQGVRLVERAVGARIARVVSGQCLGESILVQLAVDGLDRPLRLIVPADQAPAPGRVVGFEADQDEMLVFPSAPA